MSELAPYPSRLLPEDLPNYGFEVHTLPRTPEPVPINQVLANLNEVQTAFIDRYHRNDEVRVLKPGEEPNPNERTVQVIAPITVTESAYQAGVEEGRLSPLSPAHTVALDPSHAAKNGVPDYFTEEAAKALEEALPRTAIGHSDADYLLLDGSMLSRQQAVTQVFELESGYSKLRLYNFSQTPVTEDALKKILNAIREQNDRTGGAAMAAVPVMAIVSEDDPYWEPAEDLAEGLTVNAKTSGLGVITLNERLFKDDYDERRGEQHTEGAHEVPGGVEVILAHELQHALANKGKDREAHRAFGEAVGWKYETDERGKIVHGSKHTFEGDVPNPTAYGASEPDEDLGETGAALHVGGEWAAALGQKRITAMLGFWATQHTGMEGPTYIRCRELDLHNLPQKLGQGVNQPIAIRAEFPTYIIKERQPAQV